MGKSVLYGVTTRVTNISRHEHEPHNLKLNGNSRDTYNICQNTQNREKQNKNTTQEAKKRTNMDPIRKPMSELRCSRRVNSSYFL